MPPYVLIEKREGQTPLQALDELRIARPELAGVSLTYAGRLDPMASGKLLVLIGEECKNRAKYLGLDKEYEFEVLLGVESDTGDILGIPSLMTGADSYSEAEVHTAVLSLIGEHSLPYPVYSSRTVNGKPLFHYAHNGGLGEVTVPTTDMIVHEGFVRSIKTLSHQAVIRSIIRRIEQFNPVVNPMLIGSDFRKDLIVAKWKELESSAQGTVTIISCSVRVSSGTYIRTLAPMIAQLLGTKGLAHSIHRTKIHIPLTQK